MASSSSSSVLLVAALFAVFLGSAYGIPKVPPGPNITATYGDKWLDAKSTWYGKPTGAGPKDNGPKDIVSMMGVFVFHILLLYGRSKSQDNGGACGYKDVDKPPFSGMTGCGNGPIFKSGRGCGSCFEIKCSKPESCSGEPVIVHITDDNEEPIAPYHFDLSGHAFGAMAKKGEEQKLRSAGELELQFRRVKCKYPEGTKVTFHVEKGSNPNYLALLVKYVDGDGDVVAVDIKEKGKDKWIELKESWGAIWRVDTPDKLTGPFTVRYTTEGGTKAEAEDVIPEGWKADTSYEAK